jgi:hypothetical protein
VRLERAISALTADPAFNGGDYTSVPVSRHLDAVLDEEQEGGSTGGDLRDASSPRRWHCGQIS